MVRKSAFAGHFYPGDRQELQREMAEMVDFAPEKQKAIGLVSPHAGYIYSGRCAGKGFGRILLGDRVAILGISHRGSRLPLVVDGNDTWETPLGSSAVDHDLRFKLLEECKLFQLDDEAGRREHSLEVQLPFIQFVNPQAKILPVMVATHRESDLLEAGRALGKLVRLTPGLTLVASTDMSHYISVKKAKEYDGMAIEKMLALDAPGLLRTVMENNISMCGVAPTAMMLEAAKTAGATRAEVICYTHSGEVTGDTDEVVAYLSLMVY